MLKYIKLCIFSGDKSNNKSCYLLKQLIICSLVHVVWLAQEAKITRVSKFVNINHLLFSCFRMRRGIQLLTRDGLNLKKTGMFLLIGRKKFDF